VFVELVAQRVANGLFANDVGPLFGGAGVF
jgi:hypothetical protein